MENATTRFAASPWRISVFLILFAINTLPDLPGRRGRPQSNLFSLIVHDLCKRNMHINNIYDLYYLRNLAYDNWQEILAEIAMKFFDI